MRRLLRWTMWLVIISGVLVGTSYVAARARVGLVLGSPLPELGERRTGFDFEGLEGFAGNPRAWTFDYGPGQLANTPRIRVFISPTGRLIGTIPRDLESRLERFRAQRLEP